MENQYSALSLHTVKGGEYRIWNITPVKRLVVLYAERKDSLKIGKVSLYPFIYIMYRGFTLLIKGTFISTLYYRIGVLCINGILFT